MELATLSNIEFVGIGADRQIAIARTERGRRGSSASSAITLASVNSEVERHDQSLGASALDIREAYTTIASSPSNLVIDLVPDAFVTLQSECDCSDSGSALAGLNVSTVPSSTGTPSVTLPLERYRRDSHLHERIAVYVALGQPSSNLALDNAMFRRSHAPSASTGLGMDFPDVQQEPDLNVDADAATTKSVAGPDGRGRQVLRDNYWLECWLANEERRVEIQPTAAVVGEPEKQEKPQTTPLSTNGSPPVAATEPSEGNPSKPFQTSSSRSLVQMEPDDITELDKNKDTDESIRDFTRKNTKKPQQEFGERYHGRAYSRQMLRHDRKRKSEEGHHYSRPHPSSPTQLSDK